MKYKIWFSFGKFVTLEKNVYLHTLEHEYASELIVK